MATKVNKKATKTRKDNGSAALSAAEIVRYQKILANVGSRKVPGFIYMSEVGESVKGGKKADGLVFIHNISAINVACNLLDSLKIDPMMIALLQAQNLGK